MISINDLREKLVKMSHSILFLLVVLTTLKTVQSQPGLEVDKVDSILASRRMLADDDQLSGNSDKIELEGLPLTSGRKGHPWAAVDQQSCQLVQIVHLLRHPGCQSKSIASFACSGSCPSYVKTSTSKLWQHERSCSCCQQTGSQEATFTLDCPSLEPPYRKVKTHAPLNCLCRSCTDLNREDLRAQELVDALANDVPTNQGKGTIFPGRT